MKLRVRAFGLAVGVLFGLTLCLGTIYSVVLGVGRTYYDYAWVLPFLERKHLRHRLWTCWWVY